MPKVGLNTNLLKSMKLDLKVMNEVASEISSWCLEYPLVDSWKHPNKHVEFNFPEIKADIDSSHLCNYLEEKYYFLLENLHESFYTLLNAVIQLMNMMPSIVKNILCKPYKTYSVQKPSLATLCRMLWYRLEVIYKHSVNLNDCSIDYGTAFSNSFENLKDELIISEETSEESPLKTFQSCEINQQSGSTTYLITTNINTCCSSTQTSVLCLTTCESCDLTVITIRCIIDAIEKLGKKYKQNTHVGKLRLEIRDEVYNITQLGAMNKWIAAICNDINKISDYIYFTIKKHNDLSREIKFKEFENSQLNRNINDFKEQILSLNNDISICNKKLEIEEIKNKRYNEKIRELENNVKEKDKDYCIIKQEKKILLDKTLSLEEKLNPILEELMISNQIVEENKQLKENLDSLKNENMRDHNNTLIRMNNTNNILKYRKEELEKINNDREILQKDMQKLNATLLKEMAFIMQQFKQLKEILKIRECEQKIIVKNLDDNVKKLKEDIRLCKHRETVLLQRLDQGTIPKVKLSHDPVKDMAAQYEVNEIRICNLRKENEKLLGTMKKYENHLKKKQQKPK